MSQVHCSMQEYNKSENYNFLFIKVNIVAFHHRFDVAELVPQTSPVLALQHAVFPTYSNHRSK